MQMLRDLIEEERRKWKLSKEPNETMFKYPDKLYTRADKLWPVGQALELTQELCSSLS